MCCLVEDWDVCYDFGCVLWVKDCEGVVSG